MPSVQFPGAIAVDLSDLAEDAKLPARDDFGDAMAWEATCLELARRSGVTIPRFEHHRFEYNSVLVVERFDREDGRRLGYLSADGMLNNRLTVTVVEFFNFDDCNRQVGRFGSLSSERINFN